MKNVLTRQDIEIGTGLTQDVIRKNEGPLGLLECKITVNKRLIFYKKKPAIENLTRLGFWK